MVNCPIQASRVNRFFATPEKTGYSRVVMTHCMARIYADNRIRELRLARGLTLEGLAALLPGDIALSTVSKLEKRTMGLTVDWMVSIADALGVAPMEIISEVQMRAVPVIGMVAAGSWQEAVQFPDGYIPVPPDTGGRRAFALRAIGDSMDLIVPDGGFVVVDPDQLDLLDGRVYVVCNGDHEATVKRYQASPAALIPCSNNTAHKPLSIGSEPFHVVGRVTYTGSSL